jgi:hypothetical protein
MAGRRSKTTDDSNEIICVRTRGKWTVPEWFVALTHDEYIQQQQFLRDSINQLLLDKITDGGKMSGVSALQDIALKCADEIRRVEALHGPAVEDTGAETGWSVFTDSDGEPVDREWKPGDGVEA